MGDFVQNVSITTLQNIKDRPVAAIEAELLEYSQYRSMVLLLPALYSEFEMPAMRCILKEIRKIGYLSKIVFSLDRADEDQFRKAKAFIGTQSAQVKIVWHESPRLKSFYDELEGQGFLVGSPGKGRSVWVALGYILSDRSVDAIALHDTDIVNYDRKLVARLFYPIVHPALNFEFSKGYYARATDKLYGRVMRLFYTPLICSLMKIIGKNKFLEYLNSFRYALSGEFAFLAPLARMMRISPTWGLEVSMLSEVYTNTTINRLAQVELQATYEHKHQNLDGSSPQEGIVRMAYEIAQTLLRVLSQDGLIMSGSFFRTLQTTYIQETRFAIERYYALALINGLKYDRHEEIAATEVFVGALLSGINEFKNNPVGIPMLPAWIRVSAALPDFKKRLAAAVEEDNA